MDEQIEPLNYTGPVADDTIDTVEISVDQVRKLLKCLNTSKTMGPDKLHARILRELADEIAEPLTHIFEASVLSGKVPDDWKHALISAIHKKGDRALPSNYRPISLTSQVCKILERIIRGSLIDHLEENRLICEEQHGFRRSRSCLTNLLETLEDWSRWDDDNHNFDVLFLDFQKAFDSVPHKRLVCKLHKLGIRGHLLNWIEDFLSERKQRVVVNGCESSWKSVTSGVPQGSVIGPLLFVCYINDLPSVIKASFCKIFADDTKIYDVVLPDVHTSQLQENVDALNSWSEENLLYFNAGKCSVMHFGKTNPRKDYCLKDENIKVSKSEKDLGVTIDDSLSFKEHVTKAIGKASQALGVIRRTFNYLNVDLFRDLYLTFIRPHLEYCVQVWSPYHRGEIDKLEKFQRRATKLVPSLTELPYEERLHRLGLTTLEERRVRGDQIEVYKILNGFENINREKFFQYRVYQGNMRGHNHMLHKQQVNKEKRRHFFSQRIVNIWNNQNQEVIEATTVNQFKDRFDKSNS